MDLVEYLTVSLGLTEVHELAGGHQSRVFRAIRRDGEPVAVKSIDASTVDRKELETRLSVVSALADLNPRVCRPQLLTDDWVIHLATPEGHERHIVAHEFALGAEPDATKPEIAERMGAALAELHESMRRLPAVALPVVGALRTASRGDEETISADQLLHGDFSASNLRQADGALRIFDFDDCGYGPREFDIANALYMVLFDQTTSGSLRTYETFRRSFVEGYVSSSGPSIRPDALDRFIGLRVRALATWLDDLANAPVGVRTASSAWHATLRSFISSYRQSMP